jgi:hypothetical protein
MEVKGFGLSIQLSSSVVDWKPIGWFKTARTEKSVPCLFNYAESTLVVYLSGFFNPEWSDLAHCFLLGNGYSVRMNPTFVRSRGLSVYLDSIGHILFEKSAFQFSQ